MSADEPWSPLPSDAHAPRTTAAVQASPLPAGSLQACVIAMGVALVSLFVTDALGPPVSDWLFATLEGQRKVVVGTLVGMLLTTAVDSTLGVLMLAGAVGVSAHLAGEQPRTILAVARRLWPGWFLWRWAQALGLIVIVPGVLVAALVGVLVDPVAFGEGRTTSLFRIPRAGGWLAAALTYAFVQGTLTQFALTLLPLWYVRLTIELAAIPAWLLWAHACRKGLAATPAAAPAAPRTG